MSYDLVLATVFNEGAIIETTQKGLIVKHTMK